MSPLAGRRLPAWYPTPPEATELGVPLRATLEGRSVAGQVSGWRLGRPDAPHKLLFLHGVGITRATWMRLLPLLSHDCDCAVVDLLGFGRSRAEPGSLVGMGAQTRVVPAVADALGWRRLVVVGHSMGGGSALGAALSWPRRVAGLVLVGSAAYPQPLPGFFLPMYLPGAHWGIAGFYQLLSRMGLGRAAGQFWSADEAIGGEVLAALCQVEVCRNFCQAVRDLRPSRHQRYPKLFRYLTQPALVIHGRCDDIVPPAVAERLGRELPDVRSLWFDRVRHMPQESRPEEVAESILAFLAKRFPGGSDGPVAPAPNPSDGS